MSPRTRHNPTRSFCPELSDRSDRINDLSDMSDVWAQSLLIKRRLTSYLALLALGLDPVIAARLVGIDHRLLA